MLLRTLLVLAPLAVAGCAVGPAAVRRMDAARIQQISDYRLCDAAAVSLDLQGRRYPVIDGEIARRGVSCDEHIAAVVSDCSALQVLNWGPDSTGQGIIFTVRNESDQAKSFRVRREERQSRLFNIGPEETTRFGITDPGVTELGEPVETYEGAGGIEVLDCHPVVGAWHINYRPQMPSPVGAAAPQAPAPLRVSPEQGVRSRAIRNVNMRSGASATQAIVGRVPAGEEVTVLGVVGTWCESTTGAGVRGYVSCDYLSPPSGGWASLSRHTGVPQSSATGTPQPFVPHIQQGAAYSEVRRLLIAGGWSPHRMPIRWCFVSDHRCDLHPETVSCATTGSAGCTYTWRRGQYFLLVTAVGERDDQMFSGASICRRLRNSRQDPAPTCQ